MSELEHLVHACIIISVAYVVMVSTLKQSNSVAAKLWMLFSGSLALSYMLVFGHTLPKFLK